jgi:hypothetical protein
MNRRWWIRLSISGPTKTGKTVLAKNVLRGTDTIWASGGAINPTWATVRRFGWRRLGDLRVRAGRHALRAVARQRLAAGQGELDLRLPGSPAGGGAALPITSSRMGHLLDALACGYDVLGFAAATGRDEVFRALVLARIIEPTSKLDSLRVLEEAGMAPPSYRTVKRRLSLYAGTEEETGGEEPAARKPPDPLPPMLPVAGGGHDWPGPARTTSGSVPRRCCSTT